MKRFHVHVSVDDLAANVRFYSALFQAEPTVLKDDYAKWMLDDPRINFAVSQRGSDTGVDHLGLQVDTDAELAELEQRFAGAALPVTTQQGTTCCYARSDKHWTLDPQGIAWESFHTLDSAPTYGQQQAPASGGACCVPTAAPVVVPHQPNTKTCC